MINTIVHLSEITYEAVDVEERLIESIKVRGIAIPVHVEVTDQGYRCTDGHKRLSACAILGKENQKYLRIPIMIVNDYSKAGSAYWGNTKRIH